MNIERPLPHVPMTCFTAYDIRGRLGAQLNGDVAFRLGRAFAETFGARCVVIGQGIVRNPDRRCH